MFRRSAFLAAVLAAGFGGGAVRGQDPGHLLAEARYAEARALLETAAEPPTTAAARFHAARLAADPGQALIHLESVPEDTYPAEREALLLERAGLLLGAGRHREVLSTLETLLAGRTARPLGQADLLAGIALRALGDDSAAERSFASVRDGDAAFAAARTALGDLAMSHSDAHLALRYYDAALAAGGERAQAGRWRALRLLGEDAAAASLLAELARQRGAGIAVLEIRRAQRDDAEALDAPVASARPDSVATAPATLRARYSLQLGAYRDRGLALDVVRRFGSLVPDLRIDEERDDRGEILYKVRTGSYMNPARARTEADRLSRELDVEVFVAEPGR